MDSNIDKDNIRGETNVLTRKRIVGPGIDHINLALQVEPTKEDTEDEKTENMIGDQAFVPPTIAFSSNMLIKYKHMTINSQVNKNITTYDTLDKNRSGRNADIITATTENVPEQLKLVYKSDHNR